MLQTICAIEQKIESLEKQIQKLNNANELKVVCDNSTPEEVLLRLRWSDHTAADADNVRQVVRAILQVKLQEYQGRLQRIVQTEESRLAALLKTHGNTNLSTSDITIQDTENN